MPSASQVKFNRAFVAKVAQGKHGPGPWNDTDSPLRLRGTKGGASFSVRRKVGGKAVTYTPRNPDGTVIENSAGVLTLDQARNWARTLVGRIAEGRSPQPEKRKPTTFKQLAEQYLLGYAKAHSSQATRTESQGCNYASQVIGDLKSAEINAQAATQLKEAYSVHPSSSRKAWGAAKRVMDMAVSSGLAETNIFSILPAPKAPRPRDRYPRLAELAAIWAACEQTKGVGASIIQFAISMPLRPGAVASLTWGEVDLEAGELRLKDGDGRKFRGEQRLPLPALAIDLLQRRRPEEPDDDALIFGSDSPKNRGGQFSGWNNAVDRIRQRSGVSNWSVHDFRRSAVSLVAEHRPDISEVALDRWLTHAASSTNAGVKGVYQRASGYRGMRLAADAWNDILLTEIRADVALLTRGE